MTWGCEQLRVSYGPTVAVDGVDLDLEPGQVTAVIGGDGAGKTSLLAAIAGSRPISGGRVRRPDRRRIGMLPATGGSWGDLTVDENLAFAAGAYDVVDDRRGARITELLDRMQLRDARGRRADRLSGGMRQKLGLAMAIVHRPDLLVLDEPTTGVDPVSRAELWRLMVRSAAHGAAVLLATTYLDEAERAGHVLLLDRGRTVVSGDVDDVVAHAADAAGLEDALVTALRDAEDRDLAHQGAGR
jgi:ABC-2 type transport system ATP-binding protein